MFQAKNGTLHIGQTSISELADKYPDPFYVYDGNAIEQRVAQIKSVLADGVEIIYSLKANPNLSLLALLSTVADGADVSSLREMQIALQTGFSPAQIFFVGPAKSHEEIEAAIKADIGCLVVESREELLETQRIAERLNKYANVALRLNPAFDFFGGKLKMGGTSTQFGIDEEQVGEIFALRQSLQRVRIIGLHAYLGTRILDWTVAARNIQQILALAAKLEERYALGLKLLDVGGGLGVPYFKGERLFDLDRFAQEINPAFIRFQRSFPGVRLIMELGRYIVAEAGIYVARVRYVKTSRGKTFVLVSGGMNHHQGTTSVGSILKDHFSLCVLNKMDKAVAGAVVVCGPLCTPADVLSRSVELPAVEAGDLIGIMNSGAYGLTASPIDFLSHRWPAEILVYGGKDHLVRRPPTLDEILQFQPLVRVKSQKYGDIRVAVPTLV
ncbi:MAG TPA: diaminopimelate decarboxylase [Candidatus Angelobacter sp.]|nr:diaminopimelate decarboxylase [Candidatus Angelobacter sp.]